MVESEFDRQFREDIEKAQALSLETLALEKFRLQKLQDEKKLLQKSDITTKKCVIVPDEIPRSRPRPGCFNTGELCVPKLKPPPRVTRKSSFSTQSSSSISVSVEDLVSFDSPPHSSTYNDDDQLISENGKSGNGREFNFDVTDKLIKDISSLENSFSSSGGTALSTNCSSVGTTGGAAYLNYNLQRPPPAARLCLPPFNSVASSSAVVDSAATAIITTTTINSNNPNVYNYYGCFNGFNCVPYRLPASCNQRVQPLPLPPAIAAVQQLPSTELSVLDVIKKKNNNNLIDLTLFPDSNKNNVVGDSATTVDVDFHLDHHHSVVKIKLAEEQNDPTVDVGDVNNYNYVKTCNKLNNNQHQRRNDKSTLSNCTTVRTSVLEAFDPLHFSSCSALSSVQNNQLQQQTSSGLNGNSCRVEESNEEQEDAEESQSECSNSLYAVFDPFDYMYSPSETSQISDPIYAAVIKTPVRSPPPLPARTYNNISSPAVATDFYKSTQNKKCLKTSINITRRTSATNDSDIIAFYNMVKNLRSKFIHTDLNTNPGMVISPMIQNVFMKNSFKLVVHCPSIRDTPVLFTCDVNSSVEHVVMYVICELDAGDSNDYILKVCGAEEYLSNNTSLGSYEYIHQCIKLDQDIEMKLIPVSSLRRPLARTAQDDLCDNELKVEDILPNESSTIIPYDSLSIVLETMEKEMKKIESSVKDASYRNNCLQTRGVTQALKAICSLLGNIEPIEISRSLSVFLEICNDISNNSLLQEKNGWAKPQILDDEGDYSMVYLDNKPTYHEIELVGYHCEKIRESVEKFVDTYCRTFNTDFELDTPIFEFTGTKPSSEVLDPVLVHVSCLHKLGANWNHDEYLVAAQIYHGTRPVGHPVLSKLAGASMSFYNRVVFDCWLNFDGINICLLPRESRLVFVVYGKSIAVNSDRSSPSNDGVTQVELGWASIQFFNYEGILSQGSYFLLLWPPCSDKRIGPAPSLGMHLYQTQPIIGIEFPCYSSHIKFTRVGKDVNSVSKEVYDFNSLDQNTQNQLLQMIEQDTYMRPLAEDREVLWEKRHYLLSKPQALPKVFLAAHSWDYACVADLHSLLHSWTPLSALDALQLLLPCFPDMEVRKVAVQWMSPLSNDEVIDFLPQLIQALKHETFQTSALAEFLLERSLICPRVAHHLYWLLVQSLPSQLLQNSNCDINNMDEKAVGNARYSRKLQLMLRILKSISGQALRDRFLNQQILVRSLYDIAENVKSTKESLRLKMLLQDLESVHDNLQETMTCLPLKLGLEVNGIQVKTCSYFPSNTLPLKISFITSENSIFPAIFKAGDDLQQDMLTLQMIRIMDKLWLKEGLDLKMVTFACVPTGERRGILEMVTEAETLRKIQIELGLTGSFKDRPIAEWLARYNPSPLGYEQAVENFTASCAGYSVATYILGICDRHNDNIMLKRSGHLFHIDFGKFLGDAQTFGNFKRDRTPFVLTSDMAYVINGGDKSTAKFHHFVDLCCQAFNIVREHGNLLLNLFGLMISSGIPGVTVEAVHYVQKALLPELSNAEAAATFARMIESSLKSWFTQFNFFLHNLSQLRFNGDHNDGELLSFVPKTYSLSQDGGGRILGVEVYGYQKRYDPEKYYMYILKVKRENQPDPFYLFRSYKEFCEFQQKLCILFPLAKCHSLHNSSPLVGRSNIKQVAEKRRWEIEKFLNLLFQMADEISHSDLVYTFFHPLLRDQQEASIHHGKLKERKSKELTNNSKCVRGQLKLAIHYQREALIVMVHHAKELPVASNGQEPSTYVKVYLLPDPGKITKRKTKVIKRSSHPSFMEMLEYRMPIELIQYRELQATIWNHDTLQENEFLGGVTLPLQQFDLFIETTNWYTLGNVYR